MLDKVLQATHLEATRGARVLYDRLTFRLYAGECLHVTGPNGVGKSTLLRQLAGLTWRGRAKVNFFGHSFAYLGHQNAIKRALTPAEQVKQAAELAGFSPSGPSPLERFDLQKQANIPCAYLSAGQSRRVALACLWARQASVWILDEPFCTLDHKNIDVICKHMLSHLSTGGSIILTSHQTFFPPTGTLPLGEVLRADTVH